MNGFTLVCISTVSLWFFVVNSQHRWGLTGETIDTDEWLHTGLYQHSVSVVLCGKQSAQVRLVNECLWKCCKCSPPHLTLCASDCMYVMPTLLFKLVTIVAFSEAVRINISRYHSHNWGILVQGKQMDCFLFKDELLGCYWVSYESFTCITWIW